MTYLIVVSQGVADFQIDYSHPGKGKESFLEENSQPGPVPFLKNGNYPTFQHIPYLCMQNIDIGLCISANLFLLYYYVQQSMHSPT